MAIITTAEVLVSSPGRNFVTLRISCDDGTTGIGDATLNGRELSVVAYLQEHVCPLLVGRDSDEIEKTWQFLYRGAYWRRGPVTMAAIAAVDAALWDIKGKHANMPVYQLLGGAVRRGLRAYGHASGTDIDDIIQSVHRLIDGGYHAVRIQSGIPGLENTYGVKSTDPLDHGDRTAEVVPQPQTELWDTDAYLAYIPQVFEAVRGEFGYDLPLLHDVHHRLTPNQATQLGRALEPYRLFWMEDPTPAENQQALKLIRDRTTTPIAIGEVFNTIWDYREIIQCQYTDFIRSSVTHAGGISHLKRIADFAALYQIRTGFHGPEDVSPVGQAAALQLGMSIQNFGIQEYAQHTADTLQVFKTSFNWENGMLSPSDAPGLGVEYDDSATAEYPYTQSYLPVANDLDGSVRDW